MKSWSKATFRSEDERRGTIEQARVSVRPAPAGIGVFKSREGLDLYLSPIATERLAPAFASALAVLECARPNELAVEVVVGPYDEPAWYDQALEDIEQELIMARADELGIIGPDIEIDDIIDQYFAA